VTFIIIIIIATLLLFSVYLSLNINPYRKILRKEVERVHEETFLFNYHTNPQNHVANNNNDKDIMKKGPISEKEKNLVKKNQLKSTYMEDPFSKKAQKGESTTLATTYNNNNNNNRSLNPRKAEIIDIPPSPQPDWGQKYGKTGTIGGRGGGQ
jgi:hypothetical protein